MVSFIVFSRLHLAQVKKHFLRQEKQLMEQKRIA